MSIDETLKERGSNYGTFEDNANFSQKLKAVFHQHHNWFRLESIQKEAIEMFIAKLSRIMSGDPDYVDNWHDIAGYATLVEQYLITQIVPIELTEKETE